MRSRLVYAVHNKSDRAIRRIRTPAPLLRLAEIVLDPKPESGPSLNGGFWRPRSHSRFGVQLRKRAGRRPAPAAPSQPKPTISNAHAGASGVATALEKL